MAQNSQKKKVKKRRATWDCAAVKALREHLSLTQQGFSEELGVRQQTVSEWETGRYRPRGPSARLLAIIAERAGFVYGADPADEDAGNADVGETDTTSW